jgi:hypothetical protein
MDGILNQKKKKRIRNRNQWSRNPESTIVTIEVPYMRRGNTAMQDYFTYTACYLLLYLSICEQIRISFPLSHPASELNKH